MNASVQGTMTLLRRTLGDGVEIESRMAPNLWGTLADPTQFESALVNLALNARDAMNGDGTLVVETANVRIDGPVRVHGADIPPGDYCALSVSDTGTGMDSETAARVFEPFFTTKPPGQGTGMGLSMVYGFASQSSGGVRIYSEVGVGTTVRIYLPRASADADAIEGDGSSVFETGELGRGETILVAEDDTDVREVVVAQLKDLGYRVITAADGEAALNVLRSGDDVDLLFTDLTMPGGLSGTELVQAARSLRPGLKALLTSGFALAGSTGRDPEYERLPLLVKPYRRSGTGGPHSRSARFLNRLATRGLERGKPPAGRVRSGAR
ncbi:MAG: ATP-binding protein [Gammaproteobacteria bacterium]|nr:ATP-binding protein [Gammaproteobacteria bacterium]